MNKIVLLLLFFSFAIKGYSQVINNKLDLSVGPVIGLFEGKTEYVEKGFKAPSFYNNFGSLSGAEIQVIFLKGDLLGVGAALSYTSAAGWSSSVSEAYNGSSAAFYALSPVLSIHTKQLPSGLFNRLSFYIELKPVAGIADISIPMPLLTVEDETGLIKAATEERDNFFGMAGDAGASFVLNQFMGFYIKAGGGAGFSSPALYPDNHFSYLSFSGGLSLRLIKDKRFYY